MCTNNMGMWEVRGIKGEVAIKVVVEIFSLKGEGGEGVHNNE